MLTIYLRGSLNYTILLYFPYTKPEKVREVKLPWCSVQFSIWVYFCHIDISSVDICVDVFCTWTNVCGQSLVVQCWTPQSKQEWIFWQRGSFCFVSGVWWNTLPVIPPLAYHIEHGPIQKLEEHDEMFFKGHFIISGSSNQGFIFLVSLVLMSYLIL